MDRFVQRSQPRPASSSRAPLAAGTTNSSKRPKQDSHGPSAKRARLEEVKDSEESGGDDDDTLSRTLSNDQDEGTSISGSHEDEIFSAPRIQGLANDTPEESENEVDGVPVETTRKTAFESSLPAVATDREAIRQYEAMRASQSSQDVADDTASRLDKRQWVPGKSSIYVDAFNLALDTVLEDESHLFDGKEKCVFERWRALGYEAQYLYVRLFLRKAASWHRIDRLGYHSDISDVNLAIATLLESHKFPKTPSEPSSEGQILEDLQDWSLGDSFSFFDDSESHIKSLEEAVTLLSLDELKMLAKAAKVQGKNKAGLIQAICRTSSRQSSLMSLGLRRSSTQGSTDSRDFNSGSETPEKQEPNRNLHFLNKIIAITGPLIRLSEPILKLFERVHLVFYRSTEWTEKSLTTIILAKMARRNFPEYIVCRSSNIFASRRDLLEFELSMRREFEVDKVLEFNGPPGEVGFLKVVDIFEGISARWRDLLREEQHREDHVYEFGEGGYLRRFNAAHAYTRIAHKAAHVLGRLHRYKEEHELLTELLEQRLFHPARRGSWYQRKALLEERYMWEVDPDPISPNPEVQKKHWQRIALITCETALEDRNCHLIYHYDIQKRLLKLEKRMKVPRRLQHDFAHVKLREPEEHTMEGIQLVSDEADIKGKAGRGPSTKTVWLDDLGEPDEDGKPPQVSVEEMCLSHYRHEGWKGYHSEGGILRTLFAYLFFDILFVYVPNVFQTAYQTCPLDLHTDAFYPTRASQILHRLVEIENGGAEKILRGVHEREQEKRTCVVGLNWDYDINDLLELVACFEGGALAAVCKVMAEDYRARGGGVPDLVLWRTKQCDPDTSDNSNSRKGEVMFSEVKSANDRLSDTQRLWIHVLSGAGVRVALCNAVAREVRTLR
ncbi:VRR-NUC domain-containing protein [Podospora australis]|uniref:Fanconi-associated nuclease n=1 Tax=Podospora australis TaxID=1536484 RepID=A0AAN6WYW2_9PEZI|nr:VRR-NUC domain-containing protein [Podospora australis]